MIREDLLTRELQHYKRAYGVDLEPFRYNRDFVFNLFRKYTNWGCTIVSYCCNGEEQACWYDPIEEGIWGFDLPRVRSAILDTFKETKNITRSSKNKRMYMYKDDNKCHIYIYGRDVLKADYDIWFNNDNQKEM